MFRGIDDMLQRRSRLHLRHRFIACCHATCSRIRPMSARPKVGGTLLYATVEAEFDLVSAEDGSRQRGAYLRRGHG